MVEVKDLLKDIENKDLVLPEFQRDFVWGSEDFKKFITSIYKNWPTGTLLIWKTRNPPKLRGEATKSEGVYTRILLDGQQRLTTLYFILKGEKPPFYQGENLNRILKLYYNVETEKFQYYQKILMENKKEWISVIDFFVNHGDAGKFIGHVLKKADECKNEKLKDYYKKLADYYFKQLSTLNILAKIPEYDYYVDEKKLKADMNVRDIVTIFNLVNKEGRTLQEEDLALAHISVSWPDLKGLFREEIKALSTKGFTLDFNFLTRCLNSVVTGHADLDYVYKASEEEIKEGWERVKKSLEYLINILSDRAYIDSSDTYELKTDALLVPLVVYLAKNNYEFKTEEILKKFLYWFYLAMIWQRYTKRGKSSPLEQDVVTISKENKPEALLNNLRREVRDFVVKEPDLEGAPIRNPFYNMMFVVAKSKGAVDWFNGNKLHSRLIGTPYKLEKHHIFPTDVLKKAGIYDKENGRKIANEIANRVFLTKKANLNASNKDPKVYLKGVRERYPESLSQQFVPENEELWKVEYYEDFLKRRRMLIVEEINSFLQSLVAETPEMDIKELIKRDESYNLEFKSTFAWNLKEEKVDKDVKFATLKTIAAFLNTNGGTLIIGVDDNHQIVGLNQDYKANFRGDKDGFLLDFTNYVQNEFGLTVYKKYISTKFEEVNGKDIFIVRVEKSLDRVFVEIENRKILFVRLDNQTKSLYDPEEISDYIRDNWK